MKPIRASQAAFVAACLICLSAAAEANGRAGPPAPSLYAPSWQDGAPAIVGRAAWGAGSRAVAEADRWLGSANPTGTIGPWCADFISFVFERVGMKPLPNRLAPSALRYGAPDSAPHEGDLVVTAHHVGLVAHVYGDGSFDMVSGNYGRRVAAAHLARSRGMRFVTP